eukprot:1188196-Prorocentrum_minimum.AAC.5
MPCLLLLLLLLLSTCRRPCAEPARARLTPGAPDTWRPARPGAGAAVPRQGEGCGGDVRGLKRQAVYQGRRAQGQLHAEGSRPEAAVRPAATDQLGGEGGWQADLLCRRNGPGGEPGAKGREGAR